MHTFRLDQLDLHSSPSACCISSPDTPGAHMLELTSHLLYMRVPRQAHPHLFGLTLQDLTITYY